MKNLLTLIPLFVAALSLVDCFATPSGFVRTNRNYRKKASSNKEPSTARFVSSGTYDLSRSFPGDRGNEIDAQVPAVNTVPPSKIGAIVISFVTASVLVASSASRSFIANYALSLLESYKGTMVRYPLETKVATGATLAVLGDALAQTREPNQTSYNPRRAASFAAFDSCYRVFQHNAFPFIISICQGKMIGGLLSALPGVAVGPNLRAGLAALERTLVYQFAVIPLLYYPIFFTFTGYMQGLKPKEIINRAKTSFLPCWKKNLMFWIPTQMIMFGLIDEKWQIPFACVMGMLWSSILSVTAGNANKGQNK
mmetsp:Transcript_32982/g.94732  ORF Transcript_32982/g.94732 Transcript_32982/m.94732 type:complete len:311 (-) Transcript_32982:69-1001(-)|eukprot:CAMPEP_0176071504 /NCGR_PEP_ID=MMETSP0120_2-20121206/35714_1 /TAXON_ID=160619 /ORGANISM="Kryptoperidinium foliaceum, Strain CCMP 1326" /LENGTH=310 /DNA_ID=CAMNT_0017405161 /DNA_START=87 /DNA_END=1019 /DNA_ORIENTATION=-